MSANYRKLGDYISQRREKNTAINLPICGVCREGLIPPKQQDADISLYNVFYKNDFIFNPARMELNSITLNTEYDKAICSSLYEIFYINDTSKLLPEFLFVQLKTDNFVRFCEFQGQGSVREYCRFANISEYPVIVPDLKEQEKIVNTYNAITKRIQLKQKINENLEKTAQTIYENALTSKKTEISSLGNECTITTGKLNSEDATIDGEYPFFTCSQETYKTNTFAFDQEAVLLAGNNASAIYPLKIYKGKFNAYQRTYVISSNNHLISNYQIYFDLKNKLEEFKGVSFGTTTKFLTMTILNPIELHIFSEKDSYELTKQLKVCFDEITINQKELVKLNDLKQLVISRISGM